MKQLCESAVTLALAWLTRVQARLRPRPPEGAAGRQALVEDEACRLTRRVIRVLRRWEAVPDGHRLPLERLIEDLLRVELGRLRRD